MKTVIIPKASDIGDNFIVRRSLPHIEKRTVGPFVFWDHMGPVTLGPDKEMKVRAHPHIGLATITFIFDGFIMHRDSLGNEQKILPGEVNWMTAGKGIVHSERVKTDKEIKLEGIQLWVGLPKEHEQVDPSFVHVKAPELPKIEHSGAHLTLIAGAGLGEKSPVPVYSDLFYFTGETTTSFQYEVRSEQEGAVYLIKGNVNVEDKTYEPGSMLIFELGEKISFEPQGECKFMLFGGAPFPEKRHMWWNFVASEKELIEQAKEAWSSQTMGEVINETELIPLPEK